MNLVQRSLAALRCARAAAAASSGSENGAGASAPGACLPGLRGTGVRFTSTLCARAGLSLAATFAVSAITPVKNHHFVQSSIFGITKHPYFE